MVSLIKQDGETLYGIKEYILDTPLDIPDLPVNVGAGSTAFVISTSEKYMLNGQKKWILLKTTISSGSGGDNGGDIVYYKDNAGELIEF